MGRRREEGRWGGVVAFRLVGDCAGRCELLNVLSVKGGSTLERAVAYLSFMTLDRGVGVCVRSGEGGLSFRVMDSIGVVGG